MCAETVQDTFEVLESGSKFISQHAKELSDKYPQRFIAVYDNELVSVSTNFNEIMKEIIAKHLSPSKVLIQYIPGKDEIVLY